MSSSPYACTSNEFPGIDNLKARLNQAARKKREKVRLGKREMNFCSVNVEVSSRYIRLRCYLRAGVTPRFAQHYPKISTGLPRIFHRGNPVETWGSPIQTPTGTKFPKIAPSTAGNYRTENAKGLPEAQRCSCYIRHRKSMLSRIEEMSTEILRAFSICATESAQLCEGAFGGSAPDANRLRKKCKTEPAAVAGGSEAAERRTPNATILPAIARNAAATHAAAPPRSTPPTGVGSVTLVALTFFRSLSKSKAGKLRRLRGEVEHVEHIARLSVARVQAGQRPVPLNQFQHRHMIHYHVRDIVFLRIGRDHQRWHAEGEALIINCRRKDMVIPASAGVEGHDDCRAVPHRRRLHLLHQRLHEIYGVGDRSTARMHVVFRIGNDERERRQDIVLRLSGEI